MHCNTPNSSQAARKLTGPEHEDIKTGILKTGRYADFHFPVFNIPVFSALGCGPAALCLLRISAASLSCYNQLAAAGLQCGTDRATALQFCGRNRSLDQQPPSSVSIRVHRWLIPVALAMVTLAVYWPVRQHAFTNFDDPNYLTKNRHIESGLTGAGLVWAFFNLHGENSYWHPVTWVSHMLDCQVFGLNPGPHHLVNVAFHIANTLMLLILLNRMTGAFWRSAMVAALFALHPLQVETVAWAAERKNVLSTFFWLLTLWAYARYAQGRGPKSEVRSQKAESRKQNRSAVSGQLSVVTRPRTTFHVARFTLSRSTLLRLGASFLRPAG